jgi:DNA-binding XRE family transcriptional regulator
MTTNHADNFVLTVDPLVVETRRLVRRLASNVVASRRLAGLTQKQLAESAQLSRATVHVIEAGACDPRVSTVTQLARALGVSPLDLLQPVNVPAANRLPAVAAAAAAARRDA